MQFIKEATLLDWRKNLRNDLLSLAKAQVMTEMILRYAPQGVPLQEEFERLEQAIRELDEVTTEKSRIFAQWLLDTCDMWGYNLDLTTCSRCGRTLEKPAADFSPKQADSYAKRVSASSIRVHDQKRSMGFGRCKQATKLSIPNSPKTRSSPTCAITSDS